MHTVKGMVQIGGATYRIERLKHAHYRVVRIADDAQVGTFVSLPLQVTSALIEPALMYEVAQAAIRGAKTSWVGQLDFPDE